MRDPEFAFGFSPVIRKVTLSSFRQPKPAPLQQTWQWISSLIGLWERTVLSFSESSEPSRVVCVPAVWASRVQVPVPPVLQTMLCKCQLYPHLLHQEWEAAKPKQYLQPPAPPPTQACLSGGAQRSHTVTFPICALSNSGPLLLDHLKCHLVIKDREQKSAFSDSSVLRPCHTLPSQRWREGNGIGSKTGVNISLRFKTVMEDVPRQGAPTPLHLPPPTSPSLSGPASCRQCLGRTSGDRTCRCPRRT